MGERAWWVGGFFSLAVGVFAAVVGESSTEAGAGALACFAVASIISAIKETKR